VYEEKKTMNIHRLNQRKSFDYTRLFKQNPQIKEII